MDHVKLLKHSLQVLSSANETGRHVFDFFCVKLFKAHDVTVCLWRRVVGQTFHGNDHQQGTRVLFWLSWSDILKKMSPSVVLLEFKGHGFARVGNFSLMHVLTNV